MAEIGHSSVEQPSRRSSSSTTYVNVDTTEARIPAAEVDANSDYFVAVCAVYNANTASGNAAEVRIDHEGELDFSHSRIESRRSGLGRGEQYFYIERLTTDAVPDDIDLQYRYSVATQTVQMAFSQMFTRKLDDLAAADFAWDEDLTSLTALDNTVWTDGASITIGDGVSDWGIYFFVHELVDSTSAAIRIRLMIDGVAQDMIDLEGEDTIEKRCLGGHVYLANPGTSKVVKIQVQTDSATAGDHDVDCSRIMAFRLNAYEDHFGVKDDTNTPITAADTDTITGTVTHTTDTVASEDWAVMGFAINDVSEHTKETEYWLSDALLGLIAGDKFDQINNNGATDNVPLTIFGDLAALADATSLDIDFICQEEADVTPNPVIIVTHIWGHTYELAPAVFSVSLTENVDPSDSLSAVGILVGSVSEPVDLTDTQLGDKIINESLSEPVDVSDTESATMVGQGSVSEPVDPTETYSGLLSTLQSVSEPVDLTDTQVGDKVINESVSEPVDVSDAQSALARGVASVSEQVEPAESSSATKQTASSVAENVDLSESLLGAALVDRDLTENVDVAEMATAIIVQVAALSENVELTDFYTSLAKAVAAINEAADLGESWAATAIRIASLTDTVNLTDNTVAVAIVQAAISQDATIAASFAETLTARASLSAQIDLSEFHSIIVQAAATLSEQVAASDIQSALMITGASFSAAVELTERWLAVLREIGDVVRILVTARNRRIVAEASDTVVVVTAQDRRLTTEPIERRVVVTPRRKHTVVKKLN